MRSSLLDSLFDEDERRPLSVSELNEQVKGTLERKFASVWLEGEIVNFMAANSGHWYFTLHDGFSQIKAACYIRNNMRIRFKPFDGLQVRVRGKVSVYQPKGEYQILVESLEPVGEGALKIAFEQIRAKLAKEGLFDEKLKRRLPYFPKRVGVVTSPNGAAFHDILNVLGRRTKTVSITLIPTRVQGDMAGEEVEAAIRLANKYNETAREKIDVLIVGRGGGSSEDLWAFNEEIVARAIRASKIPVISAVGHEIDYTIADFAADVRAATPSAAAEMVAESEDRIIEFLNQSITDLTQLVGYKLLHSRNAVQRLTMSPVFFEFPQRLKDWKYQITDQQDRMQGALLEKFNRSEKQLALLQGRLSPLRLAGRVADNQKRLALLRQRHFSAISDAVRRAKQKMQLGMASLDALSPLAVLKRGYSITEDANGRIVTSSADLAKDDLIRVRLAEGRVEARVERTEKK